MPKYTSEEYESRIILSQKMFHQIETSLNDFLSFVPLDFNHLKVYSLKIVTIILETGPEIINSFDLAVFHSGVQSFTEAYDPSIHERREKLLEKENTLRRKNRSLTFGDYYSFLNVSCVPKISPAIIRLRDLDAYIIPFEKVNPRWCESYNLLRHDKYNNLKRATLGNALKALGALYWLIDYNSLRFHLRKDFSSDLFIITEPHEIDQSSLKRI